MKTNSKEVSRKVHNHIIEFVEEWDNGRTTIEKVKNQIDYMKIEKYSILETCRTIVECRCFLTYDNEILEFINILDLNKKLDNIQAFKMYVHLLSVELERIYQCTSKNRSGKRTNK